MNADWRFVPLEEVYLAQHQLLFEDVEAAAAAAQAVASRLESGQHRFRRENLREPRRVVTLRRPLGPPSVAVSIALGTVAGGTVAGIDEAALRALVKLEQVLPKRLQRRADALRASILPL